jgi:hypothetical protein
MVRRIKGGGGSLLVPIGGLLRTRTGVSMNGLANINHAIQLEVTDDRVFVEIDGVKGEVTLGQAREVREMLAHAAVQFIQQTTRSRRAELEMFRRVPQTAEGSAPSQFVPQ